MGRILPTLPRDGMIVQTKVAPDSAAGFRETFDRSMANLQLAHVDLLAIHGINNRDLWEETIRPGGALDAAREIIREGRATFLGFSTHAPFSPIGFNDLYCLTDQEIHTISIGAAKPSDFEEHLKIIPLLAQEGIGDRVHDIAKRLEAEFLKVNGFPMPERWDDILPSFGEVPGWINLQEIRRLWALDKAFDMQAYGKLRYNLLGNGGHWFPGINATEFDEAAIREFGVRFGIPDLATILREAHDRFGDVPRKRLQKD